MSEPRQEMTEYQKAAAVARYVEVGDIALSSVTASLGVARQDALEASEVTLGIDKSATFRFNEQSHELAVDVMYKCVLKGTRSVAAEKETAGASEEKQLVNVTGVFTIDYYFRAKGGPPAEEQDSYFQAFANLNGVFNTWPYFRELFHSTVLRMGLPPVILPVYRVASQVQPKAAPEEERQQASGTK